MGKITSIQSNKKNTLRVFVFITAFVVIVGAVVFCFKNNFFPNFNSFFKSDSKNPSSPLGLNHKYSTTNLKIANKIIEVDIAQTPVERTLGLSDRKTIVGDKNLGQGKEFSDYGMLFVFEKPDRYGFWMNQMLFPIDMIWLDEEKRVVYIERNATPESFPKTFTPTEPAKYVLEVVAGFLDKNGLKIGDHASF